MSSVTQNFTLQVPITVQSIVIQSLNKTLTRREGTDMLRPALVEAGAVKVCTKVVLEVSAKFGLESSVFVADSSFIVGVLTGLPPKGVLAHTVVLLFLTWPSACL